jgi:hypothetical protein
MVSNNRSLPGRFDSTAPLYLQRYAAHGCVDSHEILDRAAPEDNEIDIN